MNNRSTWQRPWAVSAALAALIGGLGGLGGPGCKGDKSADSGAASAQGSATAVVAATASSTVAKRPKIEPPPVADPSRLSLTGKPTQGALLMGKVDPKTRGFRFPGHRLVVSPTGEFLIAFYRNAPAKELLTITFPDRAVLEHHFEVKPRTFKDDPIDGLKKEWVTPSAATKQKLAAIRTRIKRVRMNYDKTYHARGGFVWPVSGGKITSRYGQKRILNGIDGGIHWGVDIAVPVGTWTLAPAGGKVVFAEKNLPLSGSTIIIDHGYGLSSSFLHLQTFAVKVGDMVKQGDRLATVGMTGRTTGAHLDWRMNLFEIAIDPELLFESE